jgi:hypothetical protein
MIDIKALKAEAYLRKLEPGQPKRHCQILEQIAKENGFKTWAALLASQKK